MGNYTVIAEVGQALVQLLRDKLCPDIIFSPENIGLCAPSDKGDTILGLHLYNIHENREIRGVQMRDEDPTSQRYPSLYLTLCYMVTAYSKADLKFRAIENHRIMGKVIETFQDHSVLETDVLGPANRGAGLQLHIELLNPNMEDQRKIWNGPEQDFQMSLFYAVSPVELESTRKRRIQRVVDMDMGVKE